MFYRKKNKKGFSLVELIVVVAIMAILGAVVGVSVASQIGKSRHQAVQSNVDSVRDAMKAGFTSIKVTYVPGSGTGAGSLKFTNSAAATPAKYFASASATTTTDIAATGLTTAGSATGVVFTNILDYIVSGQIDSTDTQFMKSNDIAVIFVDKGKTLGTAAGGIATTYTSDGGSKQAYFVDNDGARVAYTCPNDEPNGVFVICDCSGAERSGQYIKSQIVSVQTIISLNQ